MMWFIRKLFNLVPYYKQIKLLIRLLQVINAVIMSDKKGILSKKDEKWLSKFLDEAIKLKGIAEAVDGFAFRILIVTLDNIVIEKYVPEDWQNPIEKLIELGKARDKAGIAAFLDSKIDLPWVSDVAEIAIFNSVVTFIAGQMYKYIDSIEIAEDEK